MFGICPTIYRGELKFQKGLVFMKKFLCVLLSVLMMCSTLSVVAFAAEDDEAPLVVDKLLLESVLDEEAYYHLRYTRDNGYFDKKLLLYAGLGLADNALYNAITGSDEEKVATATLLGLVEKVEVEYQNEVVYKILDILGTAQDVAGVIEKVHDIVNWFDFVESDEWNTAFSIISEFEVYLTYGNTLWKTYIDAVSRILTCKAAGVYFEELLNYIGEEARDASVRAAAKNLAIKVNSGVEAAFADVFYKVQEDIGRQLLKEGLDALANINTVTAILSKIYGAIGDIAQFLFNTEEQYEYMVALKTIVGIEDLLPDYVRDKVANTKADSVEFALNSLVTLRTTGETMLMNLENVKADSWGGAIFNGYATPEIISRTAEQVAKLNAIAYLLEQEAQCEFDSIYVTSAPVTLNVYNSDSQTVASVSNTVEASSYDANGYYASAWCDAVDAFVKLAFVNSDAAVSAEVDAAENIYIDIACETLVNDDYYDVFYAQDRFLSSSRYIRLDFTGWTDEPTYTIIDTVNGATDMIMDTDYDSENDGVANEGDVDYGQIDKPENDDNSLVNEKGLWAKIVAFFNDLIQKIKDLFSGLSK